jgi:hypothetical protein
LPPISLMFFQDRPNHLSSCTARRANCGEGIVELLPLSSGFTYPDGSQLGAMPPRAPVSAVGAAVFSLPVWIFPATGVDSVRAMKKSRADGVE